MSYRIFTDAASDLPPRYAQQYDVTVLPMGFTLDGKSYVFSPGGGDLSVHECAEQMRAGKSVSTTMINTYNFIEAFTPVLEAGEDVVYLALSSGLSGQAHAAQAAARELRESFPKQKIACIDTLCPSISLGQLTLCAAKRKQEFDFDQMVAYVEREKLHFANWFTVQDMVYLKRGGRISGATAAMATVLNIKPIMTTDDEGHLIAVEKVQGRKKSIKTLVENTLRNMKQDGELDMIVVGNNDAPEEAEEAAQMLREGGANQVEVWDIGITVGAHSGPGTISIFYYADKRTKK